MARQGHIGRDDRRKKDGYSKKERGKTIKASSERSLSKTKESAVKAPVYGYAAADWPVEVRVSVESDAQLQAVLDRK